MSLKDVMACFRGDQEGPAERGRPVQLARSLRGLQPGRTKRARSKAAGGLVIGALDRYMREERELDERDPRFHVSDMYRFCARRYVFDLLYPPKGGTERHVSPEGQRIFDAGTRAHRWYQEHLLGPAGVLKGRWLCLHCDCVMEGFMPQECVNCQRNRGYMRYLENPVEDLDLDLVGHTDGVLALPEDGGEDRALELKTIGENGWNRVSTDPNPEHVYQLQIYMHLLKLKLGSILYYRKATSEEREYEVTYSPGPWHDVEGKLGAVVKFKRLVAANGGKVEPKWLREVRGICISPESYSAKGCRQLSPCFPRKK